jgi:hypothetical protein
MLTSESFLALTCAARVNRFYEIESYNRWEQAAV